jgi:hypothetical protein
MASSPSSKTAFKHLRVQGVIALLGIPMMFFVWGGDGAKWPNPLKSKLQ